MCRDMKKKIIYLIMAAMLVVSLSGCSNTENKKTANEQDGPAVIGQDSVDFTYESRKVTIGHDIREIERIAVYNNAIVGTGYTLDDEQVASYVFFEVDPETSEVFLYPYETERGRGVMDIAVSTERNIVYIEWEDKGEDGEGYSLVIIDRDGNKQNSIDLNHLVGDMDSVISLELDADGAIYVLTYNKVMAFDAQGSHQFSQDLDDTMEGYELLTTQKGTVVLPVYDAGRQAAVLYEMDAEAQGWKEYAELSGSSDWHAIRQGIDEETELYMLSETSLYTYDFAAEKQEELFTWLSVGLDFSLLTDYCAVNPEQFAMLYLDSGNQINEVTILTKTDKKDDDREKVTLASIYPDYSLISEFNYSNDAYYIELWDYSGYADGGDYAQAITKLNTDIIAGDIPDILDLDGINYEAYASQGVLADLYAYLDKDDMLDREDIINRVRELFEYDGGMYAMTPAFRISTVIGKSSVVGEEMGWTLDDMISLEDKAEEKQALFNGMSDLWFLSLYYELNLDKYIDYEAGTCSFDSDEFVKILEYASHFDSTEDMPEETAEDMLRKESVLLAYAELDNAYSLYIQGAYIPEDNLTAIGIPAEDGVGSAMIPTAMYGICANGKTPDGAWAFISYLLSEEYHEGAEGGIPIVQELFDKKLEDSMNPPPIEDSQLSNEVYIDGQPHEMEPMTEAQYDQMMEIIDTMGTRMGRNNELLGIIMEESVSYFEGNAAADAVAKIIQNRVSTYLAEQLG